MPYCTSRDPSGFECVHIWTSSDPVSAAVDFIFQLVVTSQLRQMVKVEPQMVADDISTHSQSHHIFSLHNLNIYR